ncbi:hypothetical protein E2C01_058557 [Portunus trituberculatus]|uniref:Uncharacterized protein n=1 Tax=Portunus trituberculatus TaxID=210409 RepID=A0A5B7GVX0_PORTR|nr:hypothetical protein [Portunus trituberculatus]
MESGAKTTTHCSRIGRVYQVTEKDGTTGREPTLLHVYLFYAEQCVRVSLRRKILKHVSAHNLLSAGQYCSTSDLALFNKSWLSSL